MTPFIVVITEGHRLHQGGVFVARWDDTQQSYVEFTRPASRGEAMVRDAHRMALALNAAEVPA